MKKYKIRDFSPIWWVINIGVVSIGLVVSGLFLIVMGG